MNARILAVLLLGMVSTGCGGALSDLGIVDVGAVSCHDDSAGMVCSTRVEVGISVPDETGLDLIVGVTSASLGDSAIAGAVSGDLGTRQKVPAVGYVAECTPGLANVYVTSTLTIASGELYTDGRELQTEIVCE